MKVLNYEFKASAGNLEMLEEKLKTLNPFFKGEDHQVDTYYNVPEGRLKLREGNIENSLIYYERQDVAGSKQSDVLLYSHSPGNGLADILEKVHGIKKQVKKIRRIYYVENVKFHFDQVEGLGGFIEVEARDEESGIGIEKLKAQCDYYFRFFNLDEKDMQHQSYSDML